MKAAVNSEGCNRWDMEGSRAICCEGYALAAALHELKKEIPIIGKYAKPPICQHYSEKEEKMRKIIPKKILPQFFNVYHRR